MRRRVTFSRNYTLSLSRTCRCYCKYCAFATHQAHLYAPDEVERAARRWPSGAGRRSCSSSPARSPRSTPSVARPPARSYGHEDFTSYVVWACERALERGLLPHTNLGVLDREDLARLREVTASQGLMLESISERLMETVHAGSPTKHPPRRLETIHAAGELRIPFTSGILVGIGETEDERIASLEALAAVHAEHGHLQEVILQNFVPHQRYYGARAGARSPTTPRARYWATGIGGPAATFRCRTGRASHDRGHEAAGRRVPAAACRTSASRCRRTSPTGGRARRRGRDRPRRPVGERRPHLARAPVPEPAPGAQAPGRRRRRADRAALRLPAVHRPGVGRARACSTRSASTTGASSRAAARGRARRRRARSAPTSSPAAIARGRARRGLTRTS